MIVDLGLRSFLTRYFLSFMGGIFATLFSLVFGTLLIASSYFPDASLADSTKYSFLSGMGLTLVVSHCHFMVARGRPQWIWPVATILVVLLVLVVPTIAYRPHKLIYFLAVLFPLLGLLLFNSKRHREMRARLVEIRRQRGLIQQSFKTRSKRR
jgi:hypothetical protein